MTHRVRVTDINTGDIIHPETNSHVVIHEGSNVHTAIKVVEGVINGVIDDMKRLPDDIATKSDVDSIYKDLEKKIKDSAIDELVFVDNDRTESSTAGSFNRGITISSLGKRAIPSIDTEGMLITVKTGLPSNAAQIFIDFHGNLYGRKANFVAAWGDWGGGAQDIDLSGYATIDNLKSYAKTSDLDPYAKSTDVATKSHKHSSSEVSESYNRYFLSGEQKEIISSVGDKEKLKAGGPTIVDAINSVSDKVDGMEFVTSVNGLSGEVTLDADNVMVSPGWSVYNELSRKASSYLLDSSIKDLSSKVVHKSDIANIEVDAKKVLMSPGWSVYDEFSRTVSKYMLNSAINGLSDKVVHNKDLPNIKDEIINSIPRKYFEVVSSKDPIYNRSEGVLYFVSD